MVAISDIERIFQRRGWRYQLREGLLYAALDGVYFTIGIAQSKQVVIVTVLLLPDRAAGRAIRARAQDLDRLIAAVNRLFNTYSVPVTFARLPGGIGFGMFVDASFGGLNEQQFVNAIGLAVAVAQDFGPIFEALTFGRITLQQALDSLARAEAEFERDSRRRSA